MDQEDENDTVAEDDCENDGEDDRHGSVLSTLVVPQPAFTSTASTASTSSSPTAKEETVTHSMFKWFLTSQETMQRQENTIQRQEEMIIVTYVT